jgi:agmatine/peptidylarginine deiminase
MQAHLPAPADVVLCGGPQSVETAKSYLADAPNVTVVPVEINDGWARDWGPSVCLPHVRPCCVGVSPRRQCRALG